MSATRIVPLAAQPDDDHAHSPIARFVLVVAERAPAKGRPSAFVRGLRLTHPRHVGPGFGARAVIRIEIDGSLRGTCMGDHTIANLPAIPVGARAVFTIEIQGVHRSTLYVDLVPVVGED